MNYVCIKIIAGLFSVDISDNRHSGGLCRRFETLGDAFMWIRGLTSVELPGLENHDFSREYRNY